MLYDTASPINVSANTTEAPSNAGRTQGRGALALRAHDLHVEVCQAAGHRQRQLHHALHRHRPPVQVVEQRPLLVVLGDEPQLRPRPVIYPEEARLFRFMKKKPARKSLPRFGAGLGMQAKNVCRPPHGDGAQGGCEVHSGASGGSGGSESDWEPDSPRAARGVPLLSAAMKPRMFSCLSITVW